VADRHANDAILKRAIDTLSELPQHDDPAVQRIVAAAAQAREQDVEPHPDDLLPSGGRGRDLHGAFARGARRTWIGVFGLAAAAAIIGFLLGSGSWRRAATPPSSRSVAAREPAASATLIASTPASSDVAMVPTQFVFEHRGAHRVLLVGDFSGWGTHAIPLVREGTSSLWEATVPLAPGRHVYAFLVDSVWTTDPRAPAARDPDFGVTGSVVIVGKP
jgi:hypothetical protein